MLKSSVAPSSLPSEPSALASGWDRVRRLAVGDVDHDGATLRMLGDPTLAMSAAILKAELIGVPPRAWLRTRAETSPSAHQPPAPSSDFFTHPRCARVVGELADRIRSLPVSGRQSRLHHRVLPYPITARGSSRRSSLPCAADGRLWMSLLMIVASSSAFRRSLLPPNGFHGGGLVKEDEAPGFFRLIQRCTCWLLAWVFWRA